MTRPLYWIGLGLILAAVLVYIALVISWKLHKADDTGSSGGFAGIEIFIGPPFVAITFLVTGICCMVSTNAMAWLVTIAILNIISAFVHIYAAYNWTGWQTPEPDACEAITRKVATAWIRLLPEALGIVLSIAAVCAAIYEMQDNGKEKTS